MSLVYAAVFNVLSMLFLFFPALRPQRQLNNALAQLVIGNAGGRRLLREQACGGHARQGIGFKAEGRAVRAQDKVHARIAAQSQRAMDAQRRRAQVRFRFGRYVRRQTSSVRPAWYLFL